jgi:hypothetical protein
MRELERDTDLFPYRVEWYREYSARPQHADWYFLQTAISFMWDLIDVSRSRSVQVIDRRTGRVIAQNARS